MLSQALKKDLEQSLILGLRTVRWLSPGQFMVILTSPKVADLSVLTNALINTDIRN